MTDLSIEAVRQFWLEYKDPMIHRVVDLMELVEPWTLDQDANFEQAVTTLSNSLTDIENLDLGQQDPIIEITNNLKTGRSLRLLQVIDIAKPGTASKLLVHAEETTKAEDDSHGLFLRRNIVFERLRLLSRVFSPDRFKLLIRALEGEESD